MEGLGIENPSDCSTYKIRHSQAICQPMLDGVYGELLTTTQKLIAKIKKEITDRVPKLFADKSNIPYNRCIIKLRADIEMLMVRAISMTLRSSRSNMGNPRRPIFTINVNSQTNPSRMPRNRAECFESHGNTTSPRCARRRFEKLPIQKPTNLLTKVARALLVISIELIGPGVLPLALKHAEEQTLELETGQAFITRLKQTPNLFMIPKLNESIEFVFMLNRLFDTACDGNDHDGIPLIETSLLCKLVLRKFASRMVSVIRRELQTRLKQWNFGEFYALYEEGRVLQALLRTSQPMCHQRGWINEFKEAARGRVHSLDAEIGGKTLRNILKEKQPDPTGIDPDIVLNEPIFLSVSYEGIEILGSPIGPKPFIDGWIDNKVANTDLQSAYTCLVHAVQHKLGYAHCSCSFDAAAFTPLEYRHEYKARFQPTSRMGDLGVRGPTKMQYMEHHWSSSVCQAMDTEVHNEKVVPCTAIEPMPTPVQERDVFGVSMTLRDIDARSDGVRTSPSTAQAYHVARTNALYLERISKVEECTFFPVTLSSSLGEDPSASIVLKRITTMLAAKNSSDHNQTIDGIRRRISFVLAKSISMCLRGSRIPRPYSVESQS
ncbi:hypothetical protein GJ496_006633 [Pomphorhynchus laevis]|nr:hypothetical protein GJ496_006633 [Pomphorhynchus laevis]